PPPPPSRPAPPAYGRLDPLAEGETYPLCLDTIRIGRASPADGIVPEIDLTPHDRTGTVSRRHAVITREGEAVYVEDSGSVNGTFVNGARLASGVQRPLQHDDQVCFGALAFRYQQVK
ncbi:MAG: FHA domain-containing protein, partial [Candidatus Eremiobacterota bacterium]